MNRDTGIRSIIPGVKFDSEVKEDLRSQLAIKKRLEGMRTPEPVQPDLRFAPVVDLKSKEIVHKEGDYGYPGYWKSEKEYEKHLISSPSKKQHEKAYNMGNSILKVSEAEKNKMADEWMRGGGRDPHGRSLDEEIKLGKDMWLEKQRVAEKKKDYPRVTNKDDPLLEAAELKKAEMLVSKANARMVTQLTNLKNWANNSKNKK